MLTSGVPEIVPLVKFRPAGSAGKIAQLLALPPLTEGISGFIVTLRVSVRLLGLYAKSNTGSSTVMLTHAVALPPVVLAYTRYCVWVMFTSGVPLNTPLEKFSPSGKTPTRAHSLTLPPETVGCSGDIVVPRISVKLFGL